MYANARMIALTIKVISFIIGTNEVVKGGLQDSQ